MGNVFASYPKSFERILRAATGTLDLVERKALFTSGRICVLDLTSGESSERSRETLTLDVPHDLSRPGAVSVVDGVRGHYLAAGGRAMVYAVVLRPLCWRLPGETCLVARSGGTTRRTRQFRLSQVERAGTPTGP
jgi:hypothetical protein